MITGKQRAKLKSISHGIRPLIQVGKNGVNQGFLDQLDRLLEDHEIVKIVLLKNSPEELDDITPFILEKMGAEFVQSIGNKLTIYRESKENPTIQI